MNPTTKAAAILALAKAAKELSLAADAVLTQTTDYSSTSALKGEELSNYLIGGLMHVDQKLEAARALIAAALVTHRAA